MTTRRPEDKEKGQALVEFLLVLPLFMLILAFIFYGGWVVFSQMTADYSSFAAARAGSVNRGSEAIPWYAPSVYEQKASWVAGEKTLHAIGGASVSVDAARFLRVQQHSTFHLGFLGSLHLGSAGDSRLQQFFPGPPSPWE